MCMQMYLLEEVLVLVNEFVQLPNVVERQAMSKHDAEVRDVQLEAHVNRILLQHKFGRRESCARCRITAPHCGD